MSEKLNNANINMGPYNDGEETDHAYEVRVNKWMRRDLDNILQEIKKLPKSRERALSITKLQESIMWLGMDLKRLNEPDPYPESKNPDSPDIAPTADGLKL